jgi:hypothetical protein
MESRCSNCDSCLGRGQTRSDADFKTHKPSSSSFASSFGFAFLLPPFKQSELIGLFTFLAASVFER